MQDIVEDALQNADNSSAETADEPEAGVFGTPTCAVVGCGPAGINRVEQVADADTAAVVGEQSTLSQLSSELPQIPVVECDPPGEYRVVDSPAFGSAVADAVGAPDTVVVTGHLETTGSVRLLETVCRQFPTETTVIVVPSVPPAGLSTDGETAFGELTDTAGLTVPYDLRAVESMAHRQTAADPVAVTNSLIVELISDLFALLRGSMAAPVLRWEAVHDQFNSGGIALLCWGWGNRDDDPTQVVADAAEHWVCDGDTHTATGGIGFVRFSEQYTLAEFESLRETARQMVAPNVDDDRWVFCGDSTLADHEEYRLTCLLTNVDPKSLGFLPRA